MKFFSCILSYLLTSIVVLFYSCGNKNQATEGQIIYNKDSLPIWILNSWKMNEEFLMHNVYEIFNKKNDSVWISKQIILKRGDTTETSESSFCFYHNKVAIEGRSINMSNKKVGSNISYNCTFFSKNKLVFENPEIEMPKKITYEKLKDSMHIIYEGIDKGGFTKKDFYYSIKKMYEDKEFIFLNDFLESKKIIIKEDSIKKECHVKYTFWADEFADSIKYDVNFCENINPIIKIYFGKNYENNENLKKWIKIYHPQIFVNKESYKWKNDSSAFYPKDSLAFSYEYFFSGHKK